MGNELLDELYRLHAARIRRRCRRTLRCDALAEDALQETFLRARRALERLRDRAAALAWLQRIAERTCLNLIRDRRRSREVILPAPPADPGPEERVAARLALERIAPGLDARALAIVTAHHLLGRAQGEVAARLGLSRRAVVKRLSSLRALAREAVTPAGLVTSNGERSRERRPSDALHGDLHHQGRLKSIAWREGRR